MMGREVKVGWWWWLEGGGRLVVMKKVQRRLFVSFRSTHPQQMHVYGKRKSVLKLR